MIITEYILNNEEKESELVVFSEKIFSFWREVSQLNNFKNNLCTMLKNESGITLSDSQKTELETKYTQLKADILAKFNDLD